MSQLTNPVNSKDLHTTGDSEVRVRFAPSPTGFLHIGGVRTALFNWLYAKKNKGKFLLRIEDTDLERSEERYTADILASLSWLGLKWDEDPVYQSRRLDAYRDATDLLLKAGHAYKCYCTEAEVEKMREKAMAVGAKPQYDRRCRDRQDYPSGLPYVIRAKTPADGYAEFNDLIRGTIRVANTEIDDFVLIRSNGAPTYNFSVVVDDVFCRITHVIRGDDHINNTPKQIHLYRFLNYKVPLFAHLPMILGPDKKKLSKRHGTVSANVYRADGFLPEALLNFLARLGWSHGDQEIFSIPELIEHFSFDHVQKSSAVFNMEKLLWLNGMHLRNTLPERLQSIVADDYGYFFSEEALARLKTDIGTKLVKLVQQKVKTVKELAEQLVPLCSPGVVEVDASVLKWGSNGNLKPMILAAMRNFTDMLRKKAGGQVDHSDIDALIRQVAEQHGLKLGDLAQPIRLAVTGRVVSASLFEIISILPWDVVEARLIKAQSF
ncbi:MAG: glutamate--tRNA ligase [Bdellovibrionota bacterium]